MISNSYFSASSPDPTNTVSKAFRHTPGSQVVREFSAEQVADKVEFGHQMPPDQEALWKAQKTIEYTQSMVEQGRKYDNDKMDDDKTTGKFSHHTDGRAIMSDGSSSKADNVVDLSPGHETFAFHTQIHKGSGQNHNYDAYYQKDDDCTILGQADGGGPFEVLIAPNGNITVFSDQ